MALLDGYFSQQTYGGNAGGLLDMLRMAQQTQQPSAGFPDSSYTMGNVQVPVFGQPEVTGQATLPPNAQPTQGQMPQQMIPQQPGLGDRLSAGFQGFAGNRGLLPALAGAAQGFSTGETPRNQTEGALVKSGMAPELAKTVARDPTLLRAVLPHLITPQGQTDDIKEFKFAQTQGFKGTWEDWMRQKRSTTGEYGMTGYWGTKNGKPALIQLGKSGGATEVALPEGFELAKDGIRVEGPTGTSIIDPQTRQVVQFIPKDHRTAEAEKAEGKELGNAVANYESMISKMPGLETVVKKLDDLSNRATYTISGQVIDWGARQAGMAPRDAAVARAEYISIVDNQILPLLRDTFGAAFTQKEGDTLRETLGDANASPQEKQAKLRAFIEQKQRDIEALAVRTGKVKPKPHSAPSSSIDDLVKKYSK